MKYSLVYITCKNQSEAKKIGNYLISEKLAACVNIIPKVNSIYIWKGKKAADQESEILAKTRLTKVKKLIQKVKKIHSYQVPAILVFDIKDGNKQYFSWMDKILK
jgi:periplasmic divalent cation tolerance protein